MSSKYPVRHPMAVRRAQRISLFCREVKRVILNLCLDNNVSTRYLDAYMDEFCDSLERHDLEYCTELLIDMLTDARLVEHTYQRYADMLT